MNIHTYVYVYLYLYVYIYIQCILPSIATSECALCVMLVRNVKNEHKQMAKELESVTNTLAGMCFGQTENECVWVREKRNLTCHLFYALYISTCKYVCIHVYIHIYTCMCTYIFHIYINIYIYICIYMYVYICVYIFIYMHIYTFIYACIYMYV